MKKQMKKRWVSAAAAATLCAGIVLGGCGNSSDEETKKEEGKKEKIVIGVSTVSTDLGESGRKALEDMGYEVEIKVFDDYVLPDSALIDGSIDANLYQHEPYMDNYNESNGTDIVMLEPKLYNYYSGLYSTKASSVDELPDGGKVGIAADAANINEQLQELQDAGVIKLSDAPASGEFFTFADVMENPHNYEFAQSDPNMYNNMDDYACLIGTSNTMAEAGVYPTKNLLQKFVHEDLAIGMCVAGENKDAEWAKDLMKAYTSDEARANVPASSGFEPVA